MGGFVSVAAAMAVTGLKRVAKSLMEASTVTREVVAVGLDEGAILNNLMEGSTVEVEQGQLVCPIEPAGGGKMQSWSWQAWKEQLRV
jgi:hypothetical protein